MKSRIVAVVLLVLVGAWLWSSWSADKTPPAGRHQTGEVVVAYTAPWCGACQLDKPYLRRLARYKEVVIIDFGAERPEFSIPLYIVYVDGVEQYRTQDVEEIY